MVIGRLATSDILSPSRPMDSSDNGYCGPRFRARSTSSFRREGDRLLERSWIGSTRARVGRGVVVGANGAADGRLVLLAVRKAALRQGDRRALGQSSAAAPAPVDDRTAAHGRVYIFADVTATGLARSAFGDGAAAGTGNP